MKKVVVVALSFAAGLGAAFLFGTVREARAEGETPRTAYFCFETSDVSDLQTKANAAGQRGWEMVAATPSRGAGTWCFKQRR